MSCVFTCETVLFVISMPDRMCTEYVDANDERRTPVMLHRAILGSFERFIGILIENYAGALPVWLSPEHAVVCSISERSADYVRDVASRLKERGFRVSPDLRAEKINRKIREHSMQKVPYILVVGEKERESRQLAVRERGGHDRGVIGIEDFAAMLQNQIDARE